jgi:Ser/Thr protein kinase RdoA (MazF antagonist)
VHHALCHPWQDAPVLKQGMASAPIPPDELAALQAVAEAFALPAPVAQIEPLGHGNVNATYRVHLSGEGQGSTVLQRLNTAVFRQPRLVMANIEAVAAHVERRLAAGNPDPEGRPWRMPVVLRGRQGGEPWLEQDGEFWRMLTYLEGTRSVEAIEGPEQAREIGAALGLFHALIHDLPAEQLADSLEGFHITPAYLEQYQRVLEASTVERCGRCEEAIAFVAERQHRAGVLEEALAAGRLQLRPIHGDPKINNLLLCEHSGRAVALIDLDTVKPGLVHYDIGDCLRSACNPHGEETSDLDAVHFDLALAEAVLQGYLGVARGFLSEADLQAIPDAIALLPFELGLRFLTDHLAGNVYFRTSRAGQNLDRALVQFRLAASVERQRAAIEALVERL